MAKTETTHTVTATFFKKKAFLRALSGYEEIGRDFLFTTTIYAEDTDLVADKVLGNPVTIEIKRDKRTRFFHGIVSDFSNLGSYGNYQVYRMELRPEFWLLTQQFDCRIYQNKSVVQIVEDVLKNESNLVTISKKLNGKYETLEYCTQYRESSYDFVCRLLEKEGIGFYFTHEKSKHTMVLFDDSANLPKVEDAAEVLYRPPGEAQAGEEHISRLQFSHRILSSKTEITDFDFENPKSDLKAKSQESVKHTHGKFERYDYPGKYTKTKVGTGYSKVLLEELRHQANEIRSFGNVLGLASGAQFKLKEHHEKTRNTDYVIVRAEYDIECNDAEPFGSVDNKFDITMRLIEKKVPYRTPAITPKPIMRGPQTAVVVGKSGEEIWTEKHGRIKVQFHWDRKGKKDENSSCWIRVAQGWAGKNWGMIHIPRIGQEVIVDFLEGDPDRPIVTGRLYNGENQTPYPLPANQTKSGFLSRSTKSGNKDTANELYFDDEKDKEEIYFHAEKDFNRVVENNDTLKVGFDKKDKGNQKVEIFNNQEIFVGDGSADDGSQKIEIQKDQTLTVKTGNRTSEIKKGDDTLKVPSGKITIEAGKEITLKVGSSKIVIKSSEISITSGTVKINGKTKAEIKAATTDVNGSGTVKVVGGVVKIN